MSQKLNDISHLLASPQLTVSPPLDIRISELPISTLPWDDFERLCLRLVEEEHSIEKCEIYGVPGSKQEGIDIFALKDSKKYDCFQCKRYQTISPSKLDEIVREFKNGSWSSKSDRFYLCTSLELNSTSLQDRFNDLRSDLKTVGIDFVKWDSVQVNRILKKHPRIVKNFFGDEWCRLFCGESYTDSNKLSIEIRDLLIEIRDQQKAGQSKNKLTSIIEKVYDKEYYWIESEMVVTFNETLEEYNATIIDKREKFVFSQEIIRSIFDLSELDKIVGDWIKDSWSPENLDHLRFIHSGLLAYSCLEKIPKDILMDLKLLNWCPIHHGYFSGHLASFIREIKMSMDLKLDLIETYRSDRYLFENLTRIIDSLRKYLEFDVNELYVEKPRASIIRNLPRNFVLVTTSNELTLRNPNSIGQIYARLPLDKQLRVSNIEVVKTQGSVYIIGINARDCFYWNPEQDLTAHFFYHASENESISNIFCKILNDGSIETILQIGKKIMVFNEFRHLKSHYMDQGLKLTPFNSGFVGIAGNYINSSGALVYKVTEDFQMIPVITIESVRTNVRAFKEINDWLKTFESEKEFPIINDLQSISLQTVDYKGEELILLRGSTNRTGVLLLIRLTKSEYEILNIIHLKESTSIAIDYENIGIDLELYCAYLDLSRKNIVFEHIKIRNFKTLELKTITRERKDDNCRDIEDISVGGNGMIYLNEMGDKILVYSKDTEEFQEFSFEKERIYFMKYYG
jgi:hypothetical protein